MLNFVSVYWCCIGDQKYAELQERTQEEYLFLFSPIGTREAN